MLIVGDAGGSPVKIASSNQSISSRDLEFVPATHHLKSGISPCFFLLGNHMTMKDGIKMWVNGAIDTMDETAQELIDGGVAPKEAVKAAALMTKRGVAERLEKNLGNLNAAEFTHGLRTQKQRPFSS